MLVASVISSSVCVRVYVMFAVIGRGCSGIHACGKRLCIRITSAVVGRRAHLHSHMATLSTKEGHYKGQCHKCKRLVQQR